MMEESGSAAAGVSPDYISHKPLCCLCFWLLREDSFICFYFYFIITTTDKNANFTGCSFSNMEFLLDFFKCFGCKVNILGFGATGAGQNKTFEDISLEI